MSKIFDQIKVSEEVRIQVDKAFEALESESAKRGTASADHELHTDDGENEGEKKFCKNWVHYGVGMSGRCEKCGEILG